MNYSLDRQKALEIAEKLGLDVSFDNENSGVFVKNMFREDTNQYSFDCFFPELKELEGLDDNQSNFITRGVGRIKSEKINITHHAPKARVINTKPFISAVDINQLNDAV